MVMSLITWKLSILCLTQPEDFQSFEMKKVISVLAMSLCRLLMLGKTPLVCKDKLDRTGGTFIFRSSQTGRNSSCRVNSFPGKKEGIL